MEHSDTNFIHYQSYLLRLWRDDLGNLRRATLQSTSTEKILHFATLELLFAFLSAPPKYPAEEEWING